jgi:predicted Fe-Mo cluster-binding NifX family protein
MRIAISAATAEGLESPISPHFGRCPYYIIVDLDDSRKIKQVGVLENLQATGHAPGELPSYIKQVGVDVMISGGMGVRAIQFFHQYGIQVATGASGTVKESLEKFLAGQLQGDAPCAESKEHQGIHD